MDLMRNALAWLEEQRGQFLTVPVSYRRGDFIVSLPASIGRTVFKVADDYGRFQYIESRDYLINTASLIINGERVLPESGDEIVEDNLIYEVMAPNNEPEWRYSDSYRQTLRIHTKLSGEADE